MVSIDVNVLSTTMPWSLKQYSPRFFRNTLHLSERPKAQAVMAVYSKLLPLKPMQLSWTVVHLQVTNFKEI